METSRKTINVVAALIRDGKRVFATAEDMGIIKAGGNFLDMRSRKGWHKLISMKDLEGISDETKEIVERMLR